MSKKRYVDLDGTLAHYETFLGPTVIGEPVPKMLQKVKDWLSFGDEVCIFTTRMGPASEFCPEGTKDQIAKAIKEWCVKHIGQELPVTGEKGFFDVGYDDNICRIIKNTGMTVEEDLLEKIRDWINDPTLKTSEEILGNVISYLGDCVINKNNS